MTFSKNIFILPLMTIGLLVSSCSAEEANASVNVTDAASAKPMVKESPGEPAVSKNDIDPNYLALFDKAREAVAMGLKDNPMNFVAGQHYDEFTTRQPLTSNGEKIEVVEFFSYGCGHCFSAEPYMDAYAGQVADDVNFIRVPVSFNQYFEQMARGYYAADALGVSEDVHKAIFEQIHIKKRQKLMTDQNALADFYASYGVDKDKFLKALNSFSVNSMIERDKKLAQVYQITGVPTVIVNGAYNTGGSKAGSYYTWFQILDFLTEKERALK